MDARILIVAPEPAIREQLRTALDHDGFDVDAVASHDEMSGFEASYDVVVGRFPCGEVARFKERAPETELVLLTTLERLAEAHAAIREGAFDFVLEPFFLDDVSLTVACASARRRGRLDDLFCYVRRNHEL